MTDNSAEMLLFMPTIIVRCMLFASSYFPLAVIFTILFYSQQPIVAYAVGILGLLGLIVMLVYIFGFAQKMEPVQGKIVERQERGSDVMGYIASYIVPFATFPLSGWQQVTSFLTFIFVLAVVYINSEMIRVNPMLNVFGYRLYEVMVEGSEDLVYLISHRRVRRGDTIHFVDVGPGIFLEKTYECVHSSKLQ